MGEKPLSRCATETFVKVKAVNYGYGSHPQSFLVRKKKKIIVSVEFTKTLFGIHSLFIETIVYYY